MAEKDTGKPYDGRAKMKMIATSKFPKNMNEHHFEEGEEFETHPNLAHNVYKKNGWATFANPEDEQDLSNVDTSILPKGKAGTMTKEGVK